MIRIYVFIQFDFCSYCFLYPVYEISSSSKAMKILPCFSQKCLLFYLLHLHLLCIQNCFLYICTYEVGIKICFQISIYKMSHYPMFKDRLFNHFSVFFLHHNSVECACVGLFLDPLFHRWQTQGPQTESRPLPCFIHHSTLFLPGGSDELLAPS